MKWTEAEYKMFQRISSTLYCTGDRKLVDEFEQWIKSGNMKWIKSPELPKEKGAYWCKLNDGLGSKNGAYFDGKKWESYRENFILEWLNEGELTSLTTPNPEDTIKTMEI